MPLYHNSSVSRFLCIQDAGGTGGEVAGGASTQAAGERGQSACVRRQGQPSGDQGHGAHQGMGVWYVCVCCVVGVYCLICVRRQGQPSGDQGHGADEGMGVWSVCVCCVVCMYCLICVCGMSMSYVYVLCLYVCLIGMCVVYGCVMCVCVSYGHRVGLA